MEATAGTFPVHELVKPEIFAMIEEFCDCFGRGESFPEAPFVLCLEARSKTDLELRMKSAGPWASS
jgi:hypothetical protein